jgi:hypothetical protein
MLGLFKNESSQPNSPDFSDVDSQSKAEDLFRRGKLERLFLMPLEFGGVDNPVNILYVPIGIAEIKDGIDRNVIAKLADEGKITEYRAVPEYQGKSFIPISIKIVASNPGSFSTLITIWGDALKRQ